MVVLTCKFSVLDWPSWESQHLSQHYDNWNRETACVSCQATGADACNGEDDRDCPGLHSLKCSLSISVTRCPVSILLNYTTTTQDTTTITFKTLIPYQWKYRDILPPFSVFRTNLAHLLWHGNLNFGRQQHLYHSKVNGANSNDCWKTNSKVLTPTNQNRSQQRDEPIRIPSYYQ